MEVEAVEMVTTGGGGGAGGFREGKETPTPDTYTASPLAAPCSGLPVTAQTYPITVGGGGTGQPSGHQMMEMVQNSNSVFSQ